VPKKLTLVPLKKRIAEIRSVYVSAAERIIAVLSSLNPETYGVIESGGAMSRITLIVRELDAAVGLWAPPAIRAAYEEAAGVAGTRLELIGAKRLPERRYDPARHERKIRALTKTVMRDYWRANRTIERTARKFLAVMDTAAAEMARIVKVQEFDSAEVRQFINRTVSAAVRARTKYNLGEAHLTSRDVAAKILARLKKMVGDGKFITIIGKDGIARDYSLRSYSELVARTRMRESQMEAIKESMKQYDEDLVEIPIHDNPCPEICAAYQGKVYSISGGTPGYELLPDGGPPWH
jgi:hypothetical protein